MPNLRINLALFRLEMIVQKEISIWINPAPQSGAFRLTVIAGHALPSIESGRPRLMNDR